MTRSPEALPRFVYGSPFVNRHKPWSAMDIAELKLAIKEGSTLSDTASFLCRSHYEVRDEAAELGLAFPRAKDGTS